MEGVKSNDKNNTSFTKKYLSHFSCSFAYKVVCIDDNLTKRLFFTEEKMQFINSLKQS